MVASVSGAVSEKTLVAGVGAALLLLPVKTFMNRRKIPVLRNSCCTVGSDQAFFMCGHPAEMRCKAACSISSSRSSVGLMNGGVVVVVVGVVGVVVAGGDDVEDVVAPEVEVEGTGEVPRIAPK